MRRILNKETIKKAGQSVKLAGWVHARRDHGQIIFIDLRDASGIIQVVFTPEQKETYQEARKLRPEWVVELEGRVNQRPDKMVNPNIATGRVEVLAEKLKILNPAETPPFEIDTDKEISEEARLKYRYLDLRRKKMKDNLILRHQANQFIRGYLHQKGFTEIETPILTKSTPEGARDYVVPSRLHPGAFYALPQSPQQYKQLLMVAGLEKYFQIARCFRDEDTRGDRQPEFTQLDIEMSFTGQEEILALVENLFIEMVGQIAPEKKIKEIPFPRLSYKEVMEKYQSDKPDLRKNKNDSHELALAFVVDFPMFEWREEEKRFDAVHHPFTRPQTENILTIKKKPDEVIAYQYDFICNGYEIGGGSLRSYRADILEAVFEVMGHKKKAIQKKFGHLLKAFQYGAPPHGGIAMGLDRWIMILADEPSIREVIAFPKTGDGRDLMMEAPSEIDPKQLKELHLKINK